MGNPFTPSSIGAAYNLNPPTDDGANTANNEVAWNKHIDKIGDPLVDFNESTDDNANIAFARIIGGGAIVTTDTSRGGGEQDQGKVIQVNEPETPPVSQIVQTTPDATAVGDPFYYIVLNLSDDNILIEGFEPGIEEDDKQTINGSESPVPVGSGIGTLVWTDGDNWFVLSEDLVPQAGAGIVSTDEDRTFIVGDRGKLIEATASDIALILDDAELFPSKTVFKFTNNSPGNINLELFEEQTYNGDLGPFRVPPRRGGEIWTDSENWFGPGFNFLQQFSRGHLGGLGTSNSAGDLNHDILFKDGEARDSLNLIDFRLFESLIKQIDSGWVPGSEVGGRAGNVSLEDETWYHMHLVLTEDRVTDIGFDTSFVADNLLNNTSGILPAPEGGFRRIGSVLTDDDGNIFAYIQEGDRWVWASMNDHKVFNESVSTSAKTFDADVPIGLKIYGSFVIGMSDQDRNVAIILSDPDTPNDGASFTAPNLNAWSDDNDGSGFQADVFTDILGQCRVRASSSISLDIAPTGWIDYRGRFD